MPVDLRNDRSEFSWEQWRWPKLLRIALANGWDPEGTTQPPDEQEHFPDGLWDPGNYTSNDDQLVSAEDAKALANALEAALPTIPDEYAMAKYEQPGGGILIAPNHPPAPDVNWFSGPQAKANVVAFIAFCRQGSFHIT